MRQKLKLLMERAGEGANSGSDRVDSPCPSEDELLGSGESDVEMGSQSDDILLEPLPRAADILAELPDYPDSEEEEQKVRNIMKELCDSEDYKVLQAVVITKKHDNAASAMDTVHDPDVDTIHPSAVDTAHYSDEERIENGSPKKETLKTIVTSEMVKFSYKCEFDTRITSRTGDEKRELSPGAVRKSKRSRIEGPQTERYVNKAGEFVTGFDPTSEEAKYRRQMRMQRFGKHADRPKGAEALDEYSSGEETNSTFDKRPEALVLYGTDDLSTDDILEYFREFSPHHIEWLDDSHCNVVWSDPHSVKRALLNMSKKYTEEELKERKEELKKRERNDPDFVLVDGTLDRPHNSDMQWRLALRDHNKAHLLFMRYSTTADTKKKGNYNQSRFYNLYGNPNLGTHGIYNKNMKYQRPQKPKMVVEPSLVNEELEQKKKMSSHVGDLRRDLRKHLNSGKIDIDKIRKERKPVEKQKIDLTTHSSSDSSTSSASSSSSSSSSSSTTESESESDNSTSASEGSEPQIISSRKVKRATVQKNITLKVTGDPRQIPSRRNRVRSPAIKRAPNASGSEEESKRQKTFKLKPNDLRAKLAARCRRG